MTARKVETVKTGIRQTDGAGVKLVRVIGYADVKSFDPFLMLDAFDSTDPDDYIRGFPWHPHRGIETVTYLIEGNIEHGDSLGNKGIIGDGCCQWMTAGSGIIHQEMPQPSARLRGLQLWLNLPAGDKMTTPQYRDLSAAMVPKVREADCTIGVIAGGYGDVTGASKGDYVKAAVLDVALEAGARWSIPTPAENTVFAYVIDGAGLFGPDQVAVASHRAILFGSGSEVAAEAQREGVRFVLFSGRPLGEPVAWGGPIVMNTQEELRQAFAELNDGTFIKGDAVIPR